ncbi:forkhead box protein N3-like [Diachasmimorpha longicaudata]|uniref:forkhead box protein N3-like n=1 Tax=Diachasmimorpha longicaudata TaxID=58733 RepID=UPI0030B9078A
MAPDRPDSSGMETACGLTVTRVLDIGDAALTLKEGDNASEFGEGSPGDTVDVVVDDNNPSGAKGVCEGAPTGKHSQDDDLTSLAWLHQQNLLKGLEISSPSKVIKDENILNNNNNICDGDSAELSENTNSVSSLDDGYYPESNGKASMNGKSQSYISSGKNYEKTASLYPESGKLTYPPQPSNQVKISLSFNNLPVSNRNKHPTHIPYDPHLHRNSKPPYSFSCLIFMAIEDSPVKALPVKEVYAWILDHFPYFKNAPTGWKNSVRHNLSLNKCFRKVEKAPNLGKGSLWMVDDQYRPNLLQALSRAPFPPPTAQNLSSPDKIPKKTTNTRLPDPILFPYLSKRLASSNITDSPDLEFDSDVDAAAVAMLSFKHGPIILNHNKDRKRKQTIEPEKLVPVITRSSSEDHTYSCITSAKTDSKRSTSSLEDSITDVDEQRKIAEGADALLNLAGVALSHNATSPRLNHHEMSPLAHQTTTPPPPSPSPPPKSSNHSSPPKSKRRTTTNDYSSLPDKRRRRWREWGDTNRYLKQVKG